MEITPIAFFHCDKKSPMEAARQGSIDQDSDLGEVRFREGHQFEQALEDIEGFSHLWLLYQFHQNQEWKPKVLPPRGTDSKKGVLATRSPYRPNALGLSCVELISKKNLSLFVRNFDLLDGSPIFDVKPYLAYADSFPEATLGWLSQADQLKFEIQFSDLAHRQLQFLETQGLGSARNILLQQLSFDPTNNQKKRVKTTGENQATFAYKTWRFDFEIRGQALTVMQIRSGYADAELLSADDKYGDKELHRAFKKFIF